jgi:hypothetical protein
MAEIAVTEEFARAVGKGVQTRPLPRRRSNGSNGRAARSNQHLTRR